jgi:hypothetical protein
VPDRLQESYNRLLFALEHLLEEVQLLADGGPEVRVDRQTLQAGPDDLPYSPKAGPPPLGAGEEVSLPAPPPSMAAGVRSYSELSAMRYKKRVRQAKYATPRVWPWAPRAATPRDRIRGAQNG